LDSSSSGTDSSDNEEEETTIPEKNKNKTKANTKVQEEDNDNDIIILDHEEFKDDIKPLEETMIHVNCYITRDILAKDDQSKHTRMAILVIQGDSTSYLQGTFYTELTSKSKTSHT